VVCGHIHQPTIREVTNSKGSCTYLNSGDWIENLTALEYHNERWTLYQYNPKTYKLSGVEQPPEEEEETIEMLSAFSLLNKRSS